jgi:hypothetical protein
VPVSAEGDGPGHEPGGGAGDAPVGATTPSAVLSVATEADGEPAWIEFQRSDASAVIEAVRAVADAADPGVHGHGVEVVIEPPRPGWLSGLFGGRDAGNQARIVVTKFGGEVGYPFHVQLVTEYGADAARRVPRLPGWAASRSAGLAFLMLKGIPEVSAGVVRYAPIRRYDWASLVGGAVAALSALHDGLPEDGRWRARVDRSVRRT